MADSEKRVAVKATKVNKSFKLPHEQHSGLKQLLINRLRGNLDKGYELQNVLKDVSFEVYEGDFFGIVGRNGSGKSTLLKLLAGIYTPDSGVIRAEGSLVPFIELGVGFNPELTGRENVFLNGSLLGFSKDQVEEMYDDIVDFAELERFMDQKLKNYSSGMQVRLAFSIAIKAQGDVLVLDEVLAVGDEAFQRKCETFFEQVKKDRSKTVILVTHSMDSVRRYCNRAMMIRDGKVIIEGSPEAVADEYSIENLKRSNKEKSKEVKAQTRKAHIKAEVSGKLVLKNTETLEVKMTYKSMSSDPVYPKIVVNYNGTPVMASNGKILYDITTADTKEHSVVYTLPLNSFNQGEVSIVALLVDSKKEVNLAEYGYNGELSVIVKNATTGNKIGGIIRDQGSMELK